MLRNRFLGGVSFMPMYAPETGAGAGAGAGGGDGGGDGAEGGTSGGLAKTEGAVATGAAAAADGGAAAGAAAGATGAEAAASAAAGTLAGGGADPRAAAAAAATPSTWPEKWRDQLAEQIKPGDKAFRTRLDRFASPADVGKSWLELEQKVSSGELKAPPAALPKDATPEQAAEWRKTHGLPETAEAYVEKLALPDGLVIGAADKPLVEDFAKSMFAAGASQDEMNRAVSWFYQTQDRQAAARAEADGQLRVDSEVALKAEWGPDFTVNRNAFGAFADLMPEDLKVAVFTARTADGRILGNTAELMKWGAQIGRELNPAATLIPNAGGDGGKAIGDEIASIESLMGDKSSEYWRGPKSEGMQSRYRELVDAQEKMKGRRAA